MDSKGSERLELSLMDANDDYTETRGRILRLRESTTYILKSTIWLRFMAYPPELHFHQLRKLMKCSFCQILITKEIWGGCELFHEAGKWLKCESHAVTDESPKSRRYFCSRLYDVLHSFTEKLIIFWRNVLWFVFALRQLFCRHFFQKKKWSHAVAIFWNQDSCFGTFTSSQINVPTRAAKSLDMNFSFSNNVSWRYKHGLSMDNEFTRVT